MTWTFPAHWTCSGTFGGSDVIELGHVGGKVARRTRHDPGMAFPFGSTLIGLTPPGDKRRLEVGRIRRLTMKTNAISTPLTTNKHLIRWVEKMADLTQPEAIHWIDGSDAENKFLCDQLVEAGTFTRLNPELWPGCFYARSSPNDVARVEDRTFICSLSKDAAGPTNNWEDPFVMRKQLKHLFRGSMRGRTMYVLPFSMGPVGSPMAQIGVQLTDSAYAVVNMRIMARIGTPVFAEIDKDEKRVVPCMHTVGAPLAPASTTSPGPATTKNTSSTSPKPARSGPTAPATAATRSLAKNASPSASPPTSPATRAGWPSTCSSSAWKLPPTATAKQKRPTSPPPSPPPAAKPTSP